MAELAEEPNRPRVLGIPHDRFATMLESEIARLEAKLEEPTDAAAAHDSRT